MDKDYIPPSKGYHKLKLARSFQQDVYLYGASGYGKTTLIRQYLDFHNYIYIDYCERFWDASIIPEEGKKECTYVVIDNLHLIDQDEIRREILELAARKDIWLILAGRCKLPEWLKQLYVDNKLMLITEEDMHMTDKEIEALAGKQGIKMSDELRQQFLDYAQGNAYAVMLTFKFISEHQMLPGREMVEKVKQAFVSYLENNVINQWDADIQQFLMKVSIVDEFTGALAQEITGEDDVDKLLERSMNLGNFMVCNEGVYRLRDVLIAALQKRAKNKLGTRLIHNCMYNAGRYYEQQEDIEKAFEMYEQSEDNESIRNLLIRNGRRNPGAGYYYELRKYYLALDPDEVRSDAVLMAAVSMTYSILLQEDKSEYWYQELKNYCSKVSGGEKREAEGRLAYLDIALPHRGSKGLLDIFKSIPKLVMSKGISIPEMTVTSNIPSTMNGGKDFCEWSKKDQLLADTIGTILVKVLKRNGFGLVSAGLGESYYEKGYDKYTVLKYLTRAQIESQESGRYEIAFAATGIQVRLSMLMGDVKNAYRLLDGLEEKIKEQKNKQMLRNLQALRCRLELYGGNQEYVSEWMNQAPDEVREFCTLERYRYLTKLRVMIIRGDYLKSIALIEQLNYYAEKNARTYILMELAILKSVIKYRNHEEWKEEFLEVLHKLSEYHFIRIMSEEGALVLPLLKEVKAEIRADKSFSSEWYTQMVQEAEFMKDHYPAYGLSDNVSPIDFKKEELLLLKMQSEGKTIREISECLGVKERMVKYYAAENYRKLGVKGKTDAVKKASSLNLI